MRVEHVGQEAFVLHPECESDQMLIDELDHQQHVEIAGFKRARNTDGPGFMNAAAVLRVNAQSEQALVAARGREVLRALGQLFSLGLGEAANHRLPTGTPADVQPQEAPIAGAVQLKHVLDTLLAEVGQLKVVVQELGAAHGVVSEVEPAILAQGSGAARALCSDCAHARTIHAVGARASVAVSTNLPHGTAPEVAALHRRAKEALAFAEQHFQDERVHFWRGSVKALDDLASGCGAALAAKDEGAAA